MKLRENLKEMSDNMAIKMFAVDMDGTFLNDQKKYNRERFDCLFKQMLEQDIQFVVASGNQYAQLKSFFPDTHQEMSFVAENGALVMDKGEEVFSESIPVQSIKNTLDILETVPAISVILCGKRSAYVLDTSDEKFVDMVRLFYPKLELVADFMHIDDQILKLSLGVTESKTEEIQMQLMNKLKEEITPVSSGNGSVDLIWTGTHKASGLKKLVKEETIQSHELMVFGDGGNDIEMLKLAKYGFAMANASKDVKQVAAYIAPSNNDEGVLEIIEQYLVNGILPS